MGCVLLFFSVWGATGVWPVFLPESVKGQRFLEGLEKTAQQLWLRYFDHSWAVNRETLDRALEVVDEDTEDVDEKTALDAMC